MSNSITLECQDCGTTGDVLRVTASLRCQSCGSDDLDLWEPKTAVSEEFRSNMANETRREQEHFDRIDPQRKDRNVWGTPRSLIDADEFCPDCEREHGGYGQRHYDNCPQHPNNRTAAAHGPGTGWGQSRPDPASNWSDYIGPPASANPNITRKNDSDDNHVCKVCGGTGTNPRSGGGGYAESVCRNCHGTGKVVYTTENDTPSLDAHMPKGSPLGAGSNGHYSKKKTSQAKVAVPGMKSNKVVTATQSDKIMAMASVIVANNSGLTTQEAFELARRAVVAFPEDGDL